MQEKHTAAPSLSHSLTLTARRDFALEGVQDVESFSPSQIALKTNMGKLVIRGKNLNITKLDTTGGSMLAEGSVDSLVYSPMKKSGGMMRALFK